MLIINKFKVFESWSYKQQIEFVYFNENKQLCFKRLKHYDPNKKWQLRFKFSFTRDGGPIIS